MWAESESMFSQGEITSKVYVPYNFSDLRLSIGSMSSRCKGVSTQGLVFFSSVQTFV